MADDAFEQRDRAHMAASLDLLLGMVEASTLARASRAQQNTPVPVVVVGGFLGAGKTTLLRHLLTGQHGLRLAAVVNDFAALNIDAELVASVSGDTTALDNGCICCSISGSVARSLVAITERAERPDAIVIEASGVAEPANIAQVATSVPGIVLDCVVGVIDATASRARSDINALVDRQLHCADIVLVNKTDLVTRDEATAIARRVAQQVPRAPILQTVNCAVPAIAIFEAGRPPLPVTQGAGSSHDIVFDSVVLTAKAPIDRARLEQILAAMPDGVMRLKGFVRFSESPGTTHEVQAVGPRWRLQPLPRDTGDSQLVAVGLRGALSRARIDDHFSVAGFTTLPTTGS